MTDKRIPITLLTGFLGAGKTTLLNTLLWQKAFEDAAVFINEFGAVGVDHLLVEKIDEEVVVLDSGCICCSMRADLPRALRGLFSRAQRKVIAVPKRVVIETSGISDPAPVIHTLLSDPFIAERFRCDGVVTVVSATHGRMQLDTHAEALKQVAMADRLILSKCDAASAEEIAALAQHLQALNPTAPQIQAASGTLDAKAILDCGLYDPASKTPDVAVWLGAEATAEQAARRALHYGKQRSAPAAHANNAVDSFVLEFEAAFVWGKFATLLDTLLQEHGEQILRIKGLVNVVGETAPRIVQCVQHVRYPSIRLAAWPDETAYADHKTRLVFITQGLSQVQVEANLSRLAALIEHDGATPHESPA